MDDGLRKACARWGLTAPALVAETPRARVYRVARGGTPAALKLLTPEGATSEAAAPGLLAHWAGHGAVGVLAAAKDALLLDWLAGPSLGEVARGGNDLGAARVLASVAARLHAVPTAAAPDGSVPLAHHLRALLEHPAPTPDMARARALAVAMLARPGRAALLHGDLHHDNVLAAPGGGWQVIDPKGVIGEPAFDLANALRNPVGLEQAAANPDRMQAMAAVFANETGAAPGRLFAWGAVQAAVSIAWDGAEAEASPDHAVLASAMALAKAHAGD